MKIIKFKYMIMVVFFFILIGTTVSLADPIKIEIPLGGWRNSKGQEIKFTQDVNYPASSVNMPKYQSGSAKIEGQVSGDIEGEKKPIQLIVNGISMPLKVEQGKFSRPYSFGSGSNNIEIRTSNGEKKTTVQFYEAYSGITQSRIRIILSWDTDRTDLDLHVVTPDGQHCYYSNRVLKNGSALDVDVTTGYGPEIFATPAPQNGTYLVLVNYYGSRTKEDLTTANLTVITHENTPDEKMQSFVIPMRMPGELSLVSSFVYP
jgi:uncharacterized protein YfaP (DUF2135 family)